MQHLPAAPARRVGWAFRRSCRSFQAHAGFRAHRPKRQRSDPRTRPLPFVRPPIAEIRLRRRFPVGPATVGAHIVPASPSIYYLARTRDSLRLGKTVLPVMGNRLSPLTSAGPGLPRNEPIMATGPPVRPSPIHGALPSSPATSSPGGPRRAGLHRRASSAGRGLPTPSYYQTNPFSPPPRWMRPRGAGHSPPVLRNEPIFLRP